jgi:APA family basic amino acid/polyamine antiporter
MMDYIVTISISAFTAAHYMGYFLPALQSWPASSLAGIGIVCGLVFVNVLGIRQSARLNIVLVSMDILTEVVVALLGVFLIISIPTIIHNIHWGVAPTTNQLLFGISISMVAYTGIETVANLGNEAKDPGKNIPRAVMLVFFVVIALYALLSMTALSAYPVYQGPDSNWVTNLTVEHLDDPILGLVHAMPHAIQPILGCWVAILAVTILIVASNAGLMGVSRLAYFMGRRQQLPSFISEINPKSRVPRNAIIIFSIIAIVLIAAGRLTFLADLYAFGAMLAYTSAHAAIIALRIKEPELHRPFKIPLNIRIRRREIPIPAVIGGLATGATWFIVLYTHHIGRIVGFAWVVVGLIIYIWYRKATKQPIIKRAR